MTEKLEYALRQIASCEMCGGKGYIGYTNGEDWDIEDCDCNTYGLILDEDGDVIYDNGLLSEPELFASMEAL